MIVFIHRIIYNDRVNGKYSLKFDINFTISAVTCIYYNFRSVKVFITVTSFGSLPFFL